MSLPQVNQEIAAAELEADQRETLEKGPPVQLLPYTANTGMTHRASCSLLPQTILMATLARTKKCRHQDRQPDFNSEYPDYAQATLTQ